jgi:competence protein ComEC
MFGLALGLFFWSNADASAEKIAAAVEEHPQSHRSLTILEDPRQGAISQTSVALLEVADVGTLKVRVFWDSGQQPLPLGTRLEARVAFRALTSSQAFLRQRGVFGSISLEEIENTGFPATPLGFIHAFREHNRLALSDFEGEGSALLRGVLLGETTELDASEAGRSFKVTGLSHLVAVSGGHLVVIAVLLSWLLRRFGLRRSAEVILVTLLLVAYVFLTGLQPSAIRACVMTFIVSMASFAGRRGHIPSALTVAAVGMLLLYPPTAFSVGFWLSVYAVFGLTIFYPLVRAYFACLLPREQATGELQNTRRHGLLRVTRAVNQAVVDPLALTVTAQAATLPITVPLFATVSLVSPLANIIVAPIITLLVGVGIATLCLMPILGPVGPWLLIFLCAVAELSISLAGWCAHLPYACLPAAFDLTLSNICALFAAALIYRLWPQPSRRRCLCGAALLGLVALALCASALLPTAPQVVMLDVGQGDAILIREGRSNVLVDTGQSDAMLLKALARQGVRHLDAVIITHLDVDHCGALEALSGAMPVEHIFFASALVEEKADDEVIQTARLLLGGRNPESLARGDTIELGTCLELSMLWPDRRATKGSNDESICLGLDYDSNGDERAELRMLLTGDAEESELEGLLAKNSDDRFEVFKVGHHGSKGAVTPEQLKQMGSQVAFISVGQDNRYGHPTPETLAILEEAGMKIFRTDLNGDVSLRFEAGRHSVLCDTMTPEAQ